MKSRYASYAEYHQATEGTVCCEGEIERDADSKWHCTLADRHEGPHEAWGMDGDAPKYVWEDDNVPA